MNTTIQLNCTSSGEGANLRFERIVSVNGEEVYRDSRKASVCLPDSDPIHNFALFLFGEKSPFCRNGVDPIKDFEKILSIFEKGGSPVLTGKTFTQQQIDQIASVLEDSPKKEDYLKAVRSRLLK